MNDKSRNVNSPMSISIRTISKGSTLNKVSSLSKGSLSKVSSSKQVSSICKDFNKVNSISSLKINEISDQYQGLKIFKKKKNVRIKNKLKLDYYEDQELDELEYDSALKYDKRTYCEYYWTLLKKKHIILFVILRIKDYNILSLKISLLLLSFSLYFSINGFFFNDNTMHKIYIENGTYNFIYHLPTTLYSTLISGIINLILRQFALTEKDILAVKSEKGIKAVEKKSKETKKFLKKRIIIFFFISFILHSFLWYFIACFCSIYQNTQIILIKDTLVTFSLSMLYPFALCLIPGLFRIPALKAKNKDKETLYKIGKIIAQI